MRLLPIIVLGILFLGHKVLERFPEYTGKLVNISAVKTVSGPVTHIRDGDTIEVSNVPIRFGSLDCAERGTRGGRIATARMIDLVQGKRLTCSLNGRKSYDRHIGSCSLPDGRDVAAVLISEGVCRRFW